MCWEDDLPDCGITYIYVAADVQALLSASAASRRGFSFQGNVCPTDRLSSGLKSDKSVFHQSPCEVTANSEAFCFT
jgi:hypothetical protein